MKSSESKVLSTGVIWRGIDFQPYFLKLFPSVIIFPFSTFGEKVFWKTWYHETDQPKRHQTETLLTRARWTWKFSPSKILPLFSLMATFKRFFFFSNFYFLAALGLCCCVRAFSSCADRGATLHCGAQASHCGGFSLWWLLLLQSTGSRARGLQ